MNKGNKTNAWQLLTQLVNWHTRKRDKSLFILKTIFVSSLVYLGGRTVLLVLDAKQIHIKIVFNGGSTLFWLDYVVVFFFVCSSLGFFVEYIYLKKKLKRTKTILIDYQGMDICLTDPLQTRIDMHYNNVTSYEINILRYMTQRHVEFPEKALQETIRQIESAKKSIGKNNPEDITFVFGGLAPVPFGFAAGYLFSNKNKIDVWDYNRDDYNKSCWYPLDRAQSISIPDFKYEENIGKEVCIVLSISFLIDLTEIKSKYPDLTIVYAIAELNRNDNMSSIYAQKEMQKRFRNLLIFLKGKGVKKIHIFSAAQSSLNFNLGRQIDGNHPQCIVYQYESQSQDKYPWGVLINDHSDDRISIVHGRISQ